MGSSGARQVDEREREGTPGGVALRAVRQRAGRTQLWVEAEAELGSGYLQRVESGRVRQPERATVERVLEVLGARYSEQRDVLERYGYRVIATAPTLEDHAWAISVSAAELAQAPGPAYVLDCLARLVVWGPLFPPLLNMRADDPWLARIQHQTLLTQYFDPRSPLGSMVQDPDTFLPGLLQALWAEIEHLRAPGLFDGFLAEQSARSPRFRQIWEGLQAQPPAISAMRAVNLIRFRTPHAGDLQFRLASETFTRDARFRLVYFLPADVPTVLRCEQWARAHAGG